MLPTQESSSALEAGDSGHAKPPTTGSSIVLGLPASAWPLELPGQRAQGGCVRAACGQLAACGLRAGSGQLAAGSVRAACGQLAASIYNNNKRPLTPKSMHQYMLTYKSVYPIIHQYTLNAYIYQYICNYIYIW